MNRIRKYENKYQVLITPFGKFDYDSFPIMLGAWLDDDHLRNYHIKEFSNLDRAVEESYEYPDINWYTMIEFSKDNYAKFHGILKSTLDSSNFIVTLESHLMTPDELKEIVFDRVMKYGTRFKLGYNLNDIFSFNVSNPWSKNLKEIQQVLNANANLKIVRNINDEETGVIHVIGKTDIGSTYEIVLYPTLVYNWVKWISSHDDILPEQRKSTLINIMKTQKSIDNSLVLR